MSLVPFSLALGVLSNDPLEQATNYKVSTPVTIKQNTVGTPLASIFLDAAGTTPLTNPSNTDLRGTLEFYVEAGEYIAEYQDNLQLVSRKFSINGNSHPALSDLNAAGGHDVIYRRKTTVAQIQSGAFTAIPSYFQVTDRADAPFDLIAEVDPADGKGILSAGVGRTAVLQTYDGSLYADRYGYSKSKTAAENGSIINSILALTSADCIVLPFPAPLEGVVISKKVKLISPTAGQFEVQTDGAFCYKLIKGAVSCIIDGISPILMGINQTKFILDGREGVGSNPQLNKFYNLNTEAGQTATQCRDGSLSLLLTNTWSNFFYGCTFNRSQNGIQLGVVGEADNQTNANYFIGCELRAVNTYTNGGQPIIQYGGDANTWLGGIIENWKLNSDIFAGGFVVTGGAYVEAIAASETFTLRGGSLKITDCFMNSPFVFVIGDSSLVYENNTVRTDLSNINYPIIQMRADVLCKMSVSGNKPKTGESIGYFTRNGKWRNSGGTWFNLTTGLKNLITDDNRTFVVAEITSDIPNATGDGTEYVLAPSGVDVILDESDEYLAGSITPRSGGLYNADGSVTLTNISAASVVTIYARSNSAGIVAVLAKQSISASTATLGEQVFNFSGCFTCEAGQQIQIRVSVSGTTKTIGIKGKSGGSLTVRNTFFTIKRLI